MKKRGGAYRGTLKARISKLYGGDVTVSKARKLKYVHDALHNFIYGHDGLVDPLQEAHMFIRQILKLPEEV